MRVVEFLRCLAHYEQPGGFRQGSQLSHRVVKGEKRVGAPLMDTNQNCLLGRDSRLDYAICHATEESFQGGT